MVETNPIPQAKRLRSLDEFDRKPFKVIPDSPGFEIPWLVILIGLAIGVAAGLLLVLT